MEGNSNLLANNANDWRSTHEPDLRKKIIFAIVEKLKICFPNHSQNAINNAAFKFEGKIYDMARDKSDYLQKISEKIMVFNKKFRSVQCGSSFNGPNTPDPAQALNHGQSLPPSLPYTQNPTSQQWFHQNNIHNNLNIHEFSGFSTQVPITVSGAQNQNIQMGEGVHGRQQLLTQSQQQRQSYKDMLQCQVDQRLLKENIHHLQPPYMQHQQHQQSLLKQPVQQQLPHLTTLSTIHQSFPQSSSLSSLTPSGHQNYQFLPVHQFPTQRVHSSHQQQMVVPSEEQERQKLISQLMNGQDTQTNHLASLQNNWEQQRSHTISSSQQKNIASFQEMAHQNNNLYNMRQQQSLYSHSNNASALPSQQQQQYMHGGQSGNFNVYESSLFGTQGQEVVQSQPMMLQQYQQPQNSILQQHLDDTQRFQATCSFHQTQNIGNQQNQLYQSERAPPENPSTSQDSTDKTANANGEDWQEETYQKIKTLKEKYLHVLSILLQKVSDKLREVDSLPQQKMQQEPIQKLRVGKSTLELLIVFLNVGRDNISETHRDRFSLYEEQILRFTKNNQTVTQSPMQNQQSQSGYNQVHVSQSLDNDQMSSRLTPSHQSSSQLVDQQILSTTFHNTGASASSQPLVSPFVAPSPSLGDLEKHVYVESPVAHDYQLQTAAQEQPIDHLIKAFQSSSPESLTQSVTHMSSVISLADRLAGSVHFIGGSRASLAEDLSARTTLPLESEANSTSSADSKVYKIKPGCALLKEIKDINESLVETVVNICNEDVYPSEVTSGTVVTCSYSHVALSDIFEAHYKSGHMIQPLRLLVPVNYPYSPILLLEKLPSDSSLHKYDDLSARTRSRFSLSMKAFSEPMSLKEIAQVWDVCARVTMAEYAERHGGGTFSSKYGH